jgi:flagellar hook-associated protein 1 FlgK
VQVNLTGAAGDTTLNSLQASLSAVPGITASIQGGKLSLQAAAGTQISFSQDTSNTLAALGINTFFTGDSAGTIAVNPVIASNTDMIAAAQNGDSGDNSNALAIAQLGDAPQAVLGSQSVNQAYSTLVGNVATTTATANSNAQATQEVQNTLQSQRDSLSGVSIDNETINMLQEQRAFQGASRLIYTIDQMMQSLMQMTT